MHSMNRKFKAGDKVNVLSAENLNKHSTFSVYSYTDDDVELVVLDENNNFYFVSSENVIFFRPEDEKLMI